MIKLDVEIEIEFEMELERFRLLFFLMSSWHYLSKKVYEY